MRISDWSSDVCSSDLGFHWPAQFDGERLTMTIPGLPSGYANPAFGNAIFLYIRADPVLEPDTDATLKLLHVEMWAAWLGREAIGRCVGHRSEEHTSELQSLMRISYAVFCLNKKKHE